VASLENECLWIPQIQTDLTHDKRSHLFGGFLLLTALYILFNRYAFLVGPQKFFVQKILSLKNPLLFQRDILTTLQNETYYTFLAWPIAFLSRWLDLRWIFFVGHFITTFFYLYGVNALGQVLFKDSRVAFLATLGVFFIKPVLVDSSLYPTVFYHRNVSWVFQIFSMIAFLRKRPIASGVLLGLAFDATPYSATHLFLVFAVAVLLDRSFLGWQGLLKGSVGFLVTATPMVLWRLARSGDIPLGPPPSDWLLLLRKTASIYCFPSTFLKPEYGHLNTFLMALVWPFLFFASFFRKFLSWDGVHRTVGLWVIGIGFLFVLGTVFTELWPLSSVLQLQFFRAHRIFVLLTILYFSHYLSSRFMEETHWLPRLFVAVNLTAFLASKMILCAFLTFTDFLLHGQIFKGRLKSFIQGGWVVLLLVGAAIPSSLGPALLNRAFHLDGSFILAGGVTFCFLLGSLSPLIYACLFVFTLLPSYWGITRPFFEKPFSTLAKQIEWPWTSRVSSQYLSFFDWIRNHTAPEALFLIPPDPEITGHFSLLAERGEVLSTAGSVSVTSFAYGKEWEQRMKDFGGLPADGFQKRYNQFTTDQLKALSSKYRFEYFTTFQGTQSVDFPLVFENEKMRVYRLSP